MKLAALALASNQPFVVLVRVPRRAGGFWQLCSTREPLRVGEDVAGGPATWFQPGGIGVEVPAEDLEGSLGALSVSMPNVSGVPLAMVERDDASGRGELLGQRVTCWLAHTSMLSTLDLDDPSGGGAASWTSVVLAAGAGEKKMKLECGHPAEAMLAPGPRITRAVFKSLARQGA